MPAGPARRRGSSVAVGVQHRLVALVGEGAEQLALAVEGSASSRQRLVGVAGEDHLVEALGSAPPRAATLTPSLVAARSPRPARDRRIRVGERRGQRLRRSACEPPTTVCHCGRSRKPSIPWLAKNSARKRDREAPHRGRVGRPHGGGLRHDQPVDEPARVAAVARANSPSERCLVGARRSDRASSRLKRSRSASIRQKRGRAQVRALAEHAARACPRTRSPRPRP